MYVFFPLKQRVCTHTEILPTCHSYMYVNRKRNGGTEDSLPSLPEGFLLGHTQQQRRAEFTCINSSMYGHYRNWFRVYLYQL